MSCWARPGSYSRVVRPAVEPTLKRTAAPSLQPLSSTAELTSSVMLTTWQLPRVCTLILYVFTMWACYGLVAQCQG